MKTVAAEISTTLTRRCQVFISATIMMKGNRAPNFLNETLVSTFFMRRGMATTDGPAVVPKASRSRIVGRLGDALKIAVTAPPEGGRANSAVTELLALSLDLPTSRVQCVVGHASSRKLFEIVGLTEQQVHHRLDTLAKGLDDAPRE